VELQEPGTKRKDRRMEDFGEIELVPFVDDRTRCEDCINYFGKTYGGKCKVGEVYFLDQPSRCAKFGGKLQTVKPKNIYNEGDKPFWL
jgi:hypothetical protein